MRDEGRTRMAVPVIVDALATGPMRDARTIAFEYLAATQGEAGFPIPQRIADLPPTLQAVMASLEQRHGAGPTVPVAAHR
jgi:hypothetical protein